VKERKPAEAGLILDAGALQALEGRHLRLLSDLGLAHERGLPIWIPAGALAQSWRGGPRSTTLGRLLKQPVRVVALDERAARQLGEFLSVQRLAPATRPDIVDAHAALIARQTSSIVWTSDPNDMLRYGVKREQIRRL
jgi:hypothetical protein